MRTSLFDFDLADDRIALEPTNPRDAARLLVVQPRVPSPLPCAAPAAPRDATAREGGVVLRDRRVCDLPDLLRPGDALVLNDTRVIRAALEGERLRGEHRAVVSFNLHKRLDGDRWLAFARPAKRLAEGDRIR
jgi:S-adenosylmethionine:tRNA ribosyltransferase-isomerase